MCQIWRRLRGNAVKQKYIWKEYILIKAEKITKNKRILILFLGETRSYDNCFPEQTVLKLYLNINICAYFLHFLQLYNNPRRKSSLNKDEKQNCMNNG